MSRKTMNLILILGGGLFAIISLLADVIGIGSSPGINLVQGLSVAAGLVIFLLGIIRSRNKTKE
jgi:multisubunit Na+/H+ antiporter MnhB subunit